MGLFGILYLAYSIKNCTAEAVTEWLLHISVLLCGFVVYSLFFSYSQCKTSMVGYYRVVALIQFSDSLKDVKLHSQSWSSW